ncbi:MAG: hypothetical protein GW890_08395, partial [Vibrio sp.]|nr:hypothetical protein [Vibrio sp.]
VQGVKDIGQALQSQRSKHQNHLSQVLTEEWRLLPSSLEVAYFCDQVDDLNSQAARIEAKIQHLLEQA